MIQVVSGPLNVRDAPGINGSAIGQVIEGQLASIFDGAPYWADGYWWWNIVADNGIAGWVAEGDDSLAYIGLLQPGPGPQSPADVVVQAEVPVTEVEREASSTSMPERSAVETAPDMEIAVGPPQTAVPEVAEPVPAPDPYVHLPEPVRLEREQIDSELEGVWVSLAFYSAGPGRGGPAFSWGLPEDGPPASVMYYWCESDLLTAGTPFFERVDSSESSLLSFSKNSLSVGDMRVSCTDSGGLTIAAASLDRALAFLRAPSPYPQDRVAPTQMDVVVAEGHSLTLGSLAWLEVRLKEQDVEYAINLECQAEPTGNIVNRPDLLRPIRCERTQENSGVHEVLTVDQEQGLITWEFTRPD